jgi:hypothetical protein
MLEFAENVAATKPTFDEIRLDGESFVVGRDF